MKHEAAENVLEYDSYKNRDAKQTLLKTRQLQYRFLLANSSKMMFQRTSIRSGVKSLGFKIWLVSDSSDLSSFIIV